MRAQDESVGGLVAPAQLLLIEVFRDLSSFLLNREFFIIALQENLDDPLKVRPPLRTPDLILTLPLLCSLSTRNPLS